MSEKSKPQDSAKTTAPDTPASEPSPESTARVEPAPAAPATPAANKAAARHASAPARSTVSGKDAAARDASTKDASGRIPSARSAPGDAVDSEPMRPAGRLPQLPSDDEIAAALAKTVNEADAAETARIEAIPTSVRPPAEEVAKRQAAMEKAANTKPVLTRVFQVLIAVFYPIVLLVLAIRLVTSSVFLWVEYHRPGFPADSFGFTTEDRVTYGSYTVDYLLNFAPPRYLGELVDTLGNPLFLSREVGHMADVKAVIVMAFLTGLALAIIMVIGMIYLSRRSVGGNRRALFAGSIATIALIIGLGVLAVIGWEQFFTRFHNIFFADGTWTFFTDDTLIRLFPGQFWMDAGIFIGAFVLIVSSLTLAFTWPTKDRRQAVAAAARPGRRAA